MKRKIPGPGRVRDVEGSLWVVRERRDTKYGFDLLFGTPVHRAPSHQSVPPGLIATRDLEKFWEARRTRHDGSIYDLPAGRSTLKRIRHRLGFHYHEDRSEFWNDRIADLETLSAREFAERHNVDISVVFETRLKLLGKSARPLDWWRKPKLLKILRSGITLREMGEKLGISISQAKRLRDRALPNRD